ncbi:MAG: HDIG domain-containing protein [Kiritimatiellae bacterium]|nr:HDIG domain-containing protein [Kiritimatiellia bacterium]
MNRGWPRGRQRERRRLGDEPDLPAAPQVARNRWAWAAGVVLWAVSSLLLLGVSPVLHVPLLPGQRAPVSIIALTDFEAVDSARTELARQRAADAVRPVFSISSAPLAAGLRAFERLIEHLATLRRRAPSPDEARRELANALLLLGLDLQPEEALTIVPEPGEAAAALRALTNALATVWFDGIADAAERDGPLAELVRQGQFVIETSGVAARVADLAAVRTPAEAAAEFARLAAAAGLRTPTDALRRLAIPWLHPNLVYAPTLTEMRRREAAARVEPVMAYIRAGTTLIEAGETADEHTVARLAAHERRLRERIRPADEWLRRLGRSGMLAVAAFASLLLLFVAAPEHVKQPSSLALFVVLGTLTMGGARLAVALVMNGILPRPYGDHALPTALGALLGVLLVGRPFAAAVGSWSALAVPALASAPLPTLVRGVAMIGAALIAARHARKRSLIFRAGLWIGLAGATVTAVQAVEVRDPLPVVLPQLGTVVANGLGIAAIALLVLPLLETVFGLSSDMHLLELSDPSHPLLQRLAANAPGTYHHSLMVATLARAAADAIGANGLLARVAAMYHDIGKLAKPQYFVENAPPGASPHAELSPQMSTLVILSHVREGLQLAREHRLPAPIREAIEQHHGRSLISFFYSRALDAHQQASRLGHPVGAPPEERDFRYPGPRPRRRETALIALADAVEAAARSLSNPSPRRIERLVRELVRQRYADGELDECPLTLAELRRVEDAFVFTLTAMYHGRVPYDAAAHSDRQPPAPPDPNRSAAAADRLADDTRSAAEQAQALG